MLKELAGKIKVYNKIKPIKRTGRITPKLELNKGYFICFGNNHACPCTIYEIVNEFQKTEVRVKIRVKPKYAKFKRNGITVYDPFELHLVYADEIGITPEEAVRNSV